jgi:hypothetical protein
MGFLARGVAGGCAEAERDEIEEIMFAERTWVKLVLFEEYLFSGAPCCASIGVWPAPPS